MGPFAPVTNTILFCFILEENAVKYRTSTYIQIDLIISWFIIVPYNLWFFISRKDTQLEKTTSLFGVFEASATYYSHKLGARAIIVLLFVYVYVLICELFSCINYGGGLWNLVKVWKLEVLFTMFPCQSLQMHLPYKHYSTLGGDVDIGWTIMWLHEISQINK